MCVRVVFFTSRINVCLPEVRGIRYLSSCNSMSVFSHAYKVGETCIILPSKIVTTLCLCEIDSTTGEIPLFLRYLNVIMVPAIYSFKGRGCKFYRGAHLIQKYSVLWHGVMPSNISNYFWILLLTSNNSLKWRHNGCNGISNHRRLDCLLNQPFVQA